MQDAGMNYSDSSFEDLSYLVFKINSVDKQLNPCFSNPGTNRFRVMRELLAIAST